MFFMDTVAELIDDMREQCIPTFKVKQTCNLKFKLHAGWFINRTTVELINWGPSISLKGLQC